MTNNVQVTLEKFSLGIIGALKNGIRPSTLQFSSSQIGIGDFCVFAASAINHLVNKGTLSFSEKRESAILMVSTFMRTFGHHSTSADLNEFAGIILEQKGIDNKFGGIVAAINIAG